MIEVLTVCTGNICRSPLAEQLLRTRLSDLDVHVASAGTRGLRDAPMTPEALRLATELGVDPADSSAHRSRYLTEAQLSDPDLILAMTREHRRAIVELAPSRLRSTFTVREFARLAADIDDELLREAAESAGPDASSRVRAVAALVASRRGLVLPPDDPTDDDVIDPYRRSWSTYQLSASQLEPATREVVRVLRDALAEAA
ncbi:low molecular weight phosphatase family protein [Microbacterium sp. P01]|uniref:arsenate reductase/protein-tyrosine-phosphatase family protein n=1 Tax=unclassified Microbacterium TaxID=2609290 RepID=UPI00366EE384